MAACEGMAQPVLYPGPAGIEPSPHYQVTVNGKPLFVYPCQVGATIADEKGTLDPNPPESTTPRPAAFCYFDSCVETDVEVTVEPASPHRELKSAIVRPSQRGIKPAVRENRIAFRAPAGPCQFSVEPNGSAYAALHIFINPPEKGPPRKDGLSVTRFFGPGVHEVGMLELKENSTVYIAGGAVVHGQISCARANNVRISGRGILDASRAPGKRGVSEGIEKPLGKYANQLFLAHGKGASVEGIILLDSPTWTLHVRDCRDVNIDNVKIISWRENGDGIDIVSSEGVRVENCFVRSWDDALVIKSFPYDPETKQYLWGGSKVDWKTVRPRLVIPAVNHVSFRRCVIWLDRAQALEIGKETSATAISDIDFFDIDIIHGFHVAALDIQSGDRGPIERVRFHDIRIEDQRSKYLIMISYGQTVWNPDQYLGQRLGLIRDVTFENIRITGPVPPSLLQNHAAKNLEAQAKEGNVIDGIRINNLIINGKPVRNETDLKLQRGGERVGKIVFE